MDQVIDPATVVLPKPSEVLRELLRHPPLNWTEGKFVRLVPTGNGGTVVCHCQGMMLANYAMERGVERLLNEDIGSYLLRVYSMPGSALRDATEANDHLDRDDAKMLWLHYNYLQATQQLAPKYLARVIAVYEAAGL